MPYLVFTVVIALLLVALLIYVVTRKRGGSMEPDYRTLFILGIIWLPVGLATDSSVFFVLGITFMAVGLAYKSKWREHQPLPRVSPETLD